MVYSTRVQRVNLNLRESSFAVVGYTLITHHMMQKLTGTQEHAASALSRLGGLLAQLQPAALEARVLVRRPLVGPAVCSEAATSRPYLLLMTGVSELQIQDQLFEKIWFPAAGEQLFELADVHVAATPAEAAAMLPHAEIVCYWGEDPWPYAVLSAGVSKAKNLRWLQSCSSGVETDEGSHCHCALFHSDLYIGNFYG
jgi:hypothetical protein